MALSPSNNSNMSDEQLNINIENFENPEFKDSKYVLTSPRSLQACDKLGIKPTELVSKSLADSFKEIGTKNASLPIVYQMFSQKEIDRKIKISKIRLERLEQIQNEKDLETLKEDSVKHFYKDYNALKYQDAALLNNIDEFEYGNSSRLHDLELKLATLREKEARLYETLSDDPSAKYEGLTKSEYEESLRRYLELDESFDPYLYTKKYPNKPIFDMKSIALLKQAEYEEQLARTLENSKKIRDETKEYYERKLANKKMSINNAKENREKMLAERSLRIFLDRQEKLAWKEENLNRTQRSQMMKSLVDMTKIKNKDAFIDAKTRNNALRFYDLNY